MGSLGQPLNGGSTLGGAVSSRVYLVETDLSLANDSPPPVPGPPIIHATAAFPTAGLMFGFVSGAVPGFALRLATQDFVTAADDPIRPSEHWEGRLRNAGSVTRSASLTPVGEAAVQSTVGQITVDNTDGAFDTVFDAQNAISQELAIRVGQPTSRWSNFIDLQKLRITGLTITEAELSIDVEDPSGYTVAPYPVTSYTGGGGILGDVELADAQRQVVIGRCLNVPCQLINKALLIYQIHDGAMLAIDRLMDRGVALASAGNVASYAALANAVVAPGTYVSCLSLGLVRLGDDAAGMVTADVQGHAAAGVTIRSIARFLVESIFTRLRIGYEAAYFDDLPEWQAGWVWSEPFTYQAALSRFVGDAGFNWGSTVNGLLACAQLEEPDPGDPDGFVLDETDILEIERISLPGGYESTHSRRVVRFGRMWQVMTATDFAGSVASKPDSLRRQVEWRSTAVASGTILRNAMDAETLDTSLWGATPALSLASYLIDLHGRPRQFFSVQSKIFGRIPALLGNVHITYPRFGLSGGRTLRLVSMEQNFGDGIVTYYLWG